MAAVAATEDEAALPGDEEIALAEYEEEGEEEEEKEEDEQLSVEAADGLAFFEDFSGEAAPQLLPSEAEVGAEETCEAAEENAEDHGKEKEGVTEAAEEEGVCAQCGLPGHSSTCCPFAHPEDIQLGDIEESDSDDELEKLYPLFARYVSQHVGALTPKDKRGLTGGGRYFGNEKEQAACWACAKIGHDATDCPDKGCFFCSQKGHESRQCPQRSLRCSHCFLRGHVAVSCPTLASQRLASVEAVRCMRCGVPGHANCGEPPLAVKRPLAPLPQPVCAAPPKLPPASQAASAFTKSLPHKPPETVVGQFVKAATRAPNSSPHGPGKNGAALAPPWAASPRPAAPAQQQKKKLKLPPPTAGKRRKVAAAATPKAKAPGPPLELMVCD